MQVQVATDTPPTSNAAAIPMGTGRLRAALTASGASSLLRLAHAGCSSETIVELGLDAPIPDAWTGTLDAEMAIFTEQFTAGACRFVRETIAHSKFDLLVIRTVAEKPFSATLRWPAKQTLASANRLTAIGRDSDGIPWQGEVRVHLADGELAADGDCLRIRNSHEAIVEISLGYGDEGAAAASCSRHRIAGIKGWDELVQQHVDTWRQNFGGLAGTITGKDPAPNLPDRLALLADGRPDPRLYYALWQLSRYRLCCHYATAPPTAPSGNSWLGLPPSGLPAYLARQLADADASAPVTAAARAYYDAYFPNTAAPATAGQIPARAALPSSPASAVYEAVAARDSAAVNQCLNDYLLAYPSPWLLPAGANGLEEAGILAAAFPAMLVQATPSGLILCPALPTTWTQGAVHGILAPRGWTLSIEWSMSRPSKLVIAGHPAGICELRNLPDEYTLVDDHDRPVDFEQNDDCLRFTAGPKQAYFLQRQKLRP